MMQSEAVDHAAFTGAAHGALAGLAPVAVAVTGAQITVLEVTVGLCGARRQFAAGQQSQVGGFRLYAGLAVFHRQAYVIRTELGVDG